LLTLVYMLYMFTDFRSTGYAEETSAFRSFRPLTVDFGMKVDYPIKTQILYHVIFRYSSPKKKYISCCYWNASNSVDYKYVSYGKKNMLLSDKVI